MSDERRALPDRASLRHVKLEAKRRVSAGEFPALHQAQLAVAREHGLPSWAALKRLIDAQSAPVGHALTQVRWLVSRFADADAPTWLAPDDEELRQHVADRFLDAVPPSKLVTTLVGAAARLREELVVVHEGPLYAQARIAGHQVLASTEAEEPHRLTGLRIDRLGARIADARVAAPVTHVSGQVPAPALERAESAFATVGLVGLTVAAGATDTPVWTAARGWADLDRSEVLEARHRFPAHDITKLITSTAVLRLVADGLVDLDGPANDHLRTLRLADETVTVRELLTHTGGLAESTSRFGDHVPDLVTLVGEVLACDGVRGTFAPSDTGYTALGQLVADVTGAPYPQAADRLVLAPLGMSESSFPTAWPGSDAVTGHAVTRDDTFEPTPRRVRMMPAADGLWTTAADLVRFGVGWPSLLPRTLADEALRPHAPRAVTGGHVGLGWLLTESCDIAGHAGEGLGTSASLLVTGTRAHVALANRQIPIEPVNAGVRQAAS